MPIKERTSKVRLPLHHQSRQLRKVPPWLANNGAQISAPTALWPHLDAMSKLTTTVKAVTRLRTWQIHQPCYPLSQRQDSEKGFEMMLRQQAKAHRAFRLHKQSAGTSRQRLPCTQPFKQFTLLRRLSSLLLQHLVPIWQDQNTITRHLVDNSRRTTQTIMGIATLALQRAKAKAGAKVKPTTKKARGAPCPRITIPTNWSFPN